MASYTVYIGQYLTLWFCFSCIGLLDLVNEWLCSSPLSLAYLAVCSLLRRLLQAPADAAQLSLSPPCRHLGFIMPWSTNKNHIHLGRTSGHPHPHSYIFFLRLSVRWHSSCLHILVMVSDGCCREHSRADNSLGLIPRMGLQSRLLLSLHFPRSHHTVFHTPTLIYILSTEDKGSILSTSSSLLFLLWFLWWPFSQVWDDICGLIQFPWWFLVSNTVFHIPAGNLCAFFRYVSCPFSHSSICFLVLSWIPCIFWILIPTF